MEQERETFEAAIKADGYSQEDDGAMALEWAWRGWSVARAALTPPRQMVADSAQAEQYDYKAMFEDACLDLAAIHTSLGLSDDEAGGAEPILAAIEELKASASPPAPTGAEAVAVRSDAFRDCIDAIKGAIAFGQQDVNHPPEGHWLAEFWEIGRRLAVSPSAAQEEQRSSLGPGSHCDPEALCEGCRCDYSAVIPAEVLGALVRDARRYRWLTDDLAGDEREARNALLERMAVMSHSAASAAIDAVMTAEQERA